MNIGTDRFGPRVPGSSLRRFAARATSPTECSAMDQGHHEESVPAHHISRSPVAPSTPY